MVAYFGKVRSKINIDVGFGDIVEPIKKTFPFIGYSKGPLFEKEILLLCYPKESIFAEKLETIVHRGALNSRMKDFHDLYSLIRELPFKNLKEVVHTVFEHRNTPFKIPIIFEDKGLTFLQSLWSAYLKGLRTKDAQLLPSNISELLSELNEWLLINID